MKRVKIAKYTKEKRQKARDEYNKEQSKRPLKICGIPFMSFGKASR